MSTEKESKNTRLYLVTSPAGKIIVEDTHPSTAINKVVRQDYKAEVISALEFRDLVAAGVQVFEAKADDKPD